MKFLIKLIIISILLTSLSLSAGEPDNLKKIEHVLNKLIISLNENDFEEIEPYLDDKFSFSSHRDEMARLIMRQIVAQYPKKIEGINITDHKKIESGYEIDIDIITGGEVEHKSIQFSDDFKILKAEIVTIQMHGNSNPSSKDQNFGKSEFPKETIIPFNLAGRLIVVEAEIAGKRGKFLVDSGASNIWLEKKVFPELLSNAKPIKNLPKGAGGQVSNVYETEASDFALQNIKLESAKVYLGDLSRLSTEYNIEFIGIIGSDLLHQFTIVFDYSQNELTLLYDNTSGQWQSAPNFEFDFQMIEHLPVVEIKIGDNNLKLGVDCGAEGAMIFTIWEEKLKDHYISLRNEKLKGIDNNVQDVKKVEIQQFNIGKVIFKNHNFVIGDIFLGHKPIIDGLLGYEFLSEYRTAINFPEKKIYFWVPDSE